MREEQERAERRNEVRVAARAWHRARIVDETTLDAIVALYPDDRSRVGPAFRVLLFVFALVAVLSASILLAVHDFPMGLLLVMMALVTVALTEIQMAAYRRAGTGSEEATAVLAVAFVTAAFLKLVVEGGALVAWRSVLLVLALASTAAVYRWGIPALGALAAASAFGMMAWWSGARIAWILLAALVLVPLLRGSISRDLAPSHRRACDFALVTTLLALYVALHLGSYDVGLLETELFQEFRSGEREGVLRGLIVLATAVMPMVLLFSGIGLRRPILLRSGIVFAVASLVTLRFYIHVAPLWVVLAVSGGAAMALAMVVHRYLERGAKKERHGFTAEPVFERLSPAAVLEVGMAATLAPAPVEKGEEPPFRGGGGEFGGGGASGNY